MVAEQDYSSYS